MQAVEDSYAEGVSDEFIKPVLLEGEDASTLQDGDGLFFYNFRSHYSMAFQTGMHFFRMPAGFSLGECTLLTDITGFCGQGKNGKPLFPEK